MLHRDEQTTADQQLPLELISSITLLDFPSKHANIEKWGIRDFLWYNGVNLAFKFHKTHENHTKNANTFHT